MKSNIHPKAEKVLAVAKRYVREKYTEGPNTNSGQSHPDQPRTIMKFHHVR